jgi:hypothetical protein
MTRKAGADQTSTQRLKLGNRKLFVQLVQIFHRSVSPLLVILHLQI